MTIKSYVIVQEMTVQRQRDLQERDGAWFWGKRTLSGMFAMASMEWPTPKESWMSLAKSIGVQCVTLLPPAVPFWLGCNALRSNGIFILNLGGPPSKLETPGEVSGRILNRF